MIPALVDASDLAAFPGAPFSADVVRAAAGSVRSEARWHIAPSVTETVRLDGTGGQLLLVPSLHLTGVTSVTNVAGSTPAVLDDYTFSDSGILYRAAGWPAGFRNLEVVMVHGYDECPPELLPVVAAHARAAKSATGGADVRLGSLSISPASGGGGPASAEDVLARFTIRPTA